MQRRKTSPRRSSEAGSEKEWDDIGEINDVILSRKGEVKAIVVGIGGFLGVGEKDVAVAMKDIKFVRNGDDANDYFLVINANKQILTDAPAYTASQNMAENPMCQNHDADHRRGRHSFGPT